MNPLRIRDRKLDYALYTACPDLEHGHLTGETINTIFERDKIYVVYETRPNFTF